MKVVLDKQTCISCGLCPDICPDIFEMQEDGKAGVRVGIKEALEKDEISKELVSLSKEAEESCPVSAISSR